MFKLVLSTRKCIYALNGVQKYLACMQAASIFAGCMLRCNVLGDFGQVTSVTSD